VEGDNWARGNYGANACMGAYSTNLATWQRLNAARDGQLLDGSLY